MDFHRHMGVNCRGVKYRSQGSRLSLALCTTKSFLSNFIPSQEVFNTHRIGSMYEYGTFTHIWWNLLVKVGKYTVHGSYGIY